MEYRKVGNSELKVSSIALGSWVFGGDDTWGTVDDYESIKVIEEAVEKGISIIDTAPVYGDGHAEEVIGKFLKNRPKDVLVATKCGLEKKGHSIRPNLSENFIKEEIENSLHRLKVDTIDLYQCHWPDPVTAPEETFNTLNRLVQEGKIKYIGVSNFGKKQLEEALKFSNIVSNQMRYSIFDREIEEDLIPLCKDRNISILSYGSLGGGILTGKYKEPPVFGKGDVRSFFYKFYREPFWSKGNEMVALLSDVADEYEVPVSAVAINWVRGNAQVAMCIVGSRTYQQLDDNIAASGWQLDEKDMKRINDKYKELFS